MRAFEKFHPFVLFVYFLSVLLHAMFVNHPVIQILALLGGVLFCLTLCRKKEIANDIGFYLPFFFMVAVTNPLFSHNGVTPLFFMNGNPVTLEALIYGIAIAVMVTGVMFWCKCYCKVMTSDKFLYLFGRVIPRLALVLSMAIRFIPMFKRQMRKVGRAQKAMGLYASKSYTDRIRSAMRVFFAMIAWSLENAMETSASMKARGYGLKGRSSFSLFRFSREDAVLLSVCILLFGTTILGAASGICSFYYYPRVSQIDFSWDAVIVYAAFAAVSLLPFVLEVKEDLVWKYYRSKI